MWKKSDAIGLIGVAAVVSAVLWIVCPVINNPALSLGLRIGIGLAFVIAITFIADSIYLSVMQVGRTLIKMRTTLISIYIAILLVGFGVSRLLVLLGW